MNDSRNPYAPPLTPVADAIEHPQPDTSNRFIPDGRRRSALHGARWIADALHLFRKRPGRWLLVTAIMTLPIAAATYMAIPLIMLRKLSARRAVRMSLTGSVKNILPAFFMAACMAVILMMSIIPLGLGLIVSIPVLLITNYTAYSGIFTESTSANS